MQRTIYLFAAMLMWLHATVCASDLRPGETCTDQLTVIQSVRVFDGEKIISEATVVIRCALIDRIIVTGDSTSVPPESRFVDGKGKTLLPGLIDSHTHTFSRKMLERSVDFGVTTVFDMGSLASGFKQAIDSEDAQGQAQDRADMLGAALWVTAPGSHGTQFGEVATINDPADAEQFVAARIADGADFIKVIYDNFKMIDGPVPTLSKETMQAVVDAAHRQGRMTVFHSRDVTAYIEAAIAGANGFAHVPVDEVPGEELLSLLKEKGIFVNPNLSGLTRTGARLIHDPRIGPMLTESETENLKNSRSFQREGGDLIGMDSVRIFHQNGIPVLAGTDSPNGGTAVGASMHLELELLVEVGLTPLEAMAAATSVPARSFGLNNRGRIAEGLLADLVLVEGNPAETITDTRNIVTVWKAGRAHSRTTSEDRPD